ncbi:hypothetical protein HDU76_010250 [Blyttiomyces sp. JEL0837]|nr:hypothetical protein HDU76_010250 [Blyttiomyces sp. JEL0837]
MADEAQKRREARRAKILAGSEDRLKKITQSYGGAPTPDEGSTDVKSEQNASPVPTPTPPKVISDTTRMPTKASDEPERDPPAKTTPAVAPVERKSASPSKTPAVSAVSNPVVNQPFATMMSSREQQLLDDMLSFSRSLPGDPGVATALPEETTASAPLRSSSPWANLTGALRALVVLLLAFASIAYLIGSSDETGFGEDDVDEIVDTGVVSGFLKRAKVFKTNDVRDEGNLQFGGMDIPIWGLFITMELMLQTYRFFSNQRSAPSEEPDMLQLASQLGFQTSLLSQYGKTFSSIRVMWTSLMNDIYIFVFAIGFVVMLSTIMH